MKMQFLPALLVCVMPDTPWSCAKIELNHWPKMNGGENVCPIFRGEDGHIRDYWWHDGDWRIKRHPQGWLFTGKKGDRVTQIWTADMITRHTGHDRESWEAGAILPRSQRNGFGLHSQPREKVKASWPAGFNPPKRP